MRDVQIVNEEGIVQKFAQFLTAKCATYFDKSFDEDLEFKRRKREIDSCTDRVWISFVYSSMIYLFGVGNLFLCTGNEKILDERIRNRRM